MQKRKQRKRTDTRVAELEREMRAMRAMLKNKESGKANSGASKPEQAQIPAGLWYQENIQGAPVRAMEAVKQGLPQVEERNTNLSLGQAAQAQRDVPSLWPTRFADKPRATKPDVVECGIISMATARQLFETYRKDLFPHYPMVHIPDSITADEVRQTKPTLFLAIIAAASGKNNSELSAMLDSEVLQTYATKSLVYSEKSLELVQALLVSAVWYHPPAKFGQLKYYEYIHMAATMAMDIGIGTRKVSHRSRFGSKAIEREGRKPNIHPLEDAKNPDLSMTPRSKDQSPDTSSIESRRAFLACYNICSTVSMSLRRPNMLRVSSYVRECLEYIERSPDAVPSDRTLAAWVKLIMIAEEIGNGFAYDDPGGIAAVSELRTQIMLKDFEKRLSKWYTDVPEVDMNESLTMMYYTIRIYLHEVALHVEHSPEDFKAPYQMGPIHSWDGDEIPTQVLAGCVAECITSAHQLLNTFLGLDAERARALPVFSYVRISYAAFVLAKLCLSAAHPGARIGQVLDRSSLKVESFMDRAILHVRAIVGPVKCRIPAVFLALLFKLRQWCMNPAMIELSEDTTALDVGKSANAGSRPEQQDSATRYIEGPRVMEHVSSDDTSPQTSESQSESYESMGDYATRTFGNLDPIIPAVLTPQSNLPEHDGNASAAGASTQGTDIESTGSVPNSTAGISLPQTSPWLQPNDQMDLDQNFFQFFGDMNVLSQGGLTGLDDWSSMPTDFANFPANFNWQGLDATDGSAAL